VAAIKRAQGISRTDGLRSASSVVETYLRRVRAEKKVNLYRELPRWREAIGEDLAEVTIPEKISRNILYVRVLDDVWAQELSFKKAEILRRLYAAKAVPPLDDIVFVTGDPNDFREE
jgi:predicted nucleic acid-binding Zn ribbon protein